jgi:hypothetical protein
MKATDPKSYTIGAHLCEGLASRKKHKPDAGEIRLYRLAAAYATAFVHLTSHGLRLQIRDEKDI